MGRSSISLPYRDLRKSVLDSYSASAHLCLQHVQERDAFEIATTGDLPCPRAAHRCPPSALSPRSRRSAKQKMPGTHVIRSVSRSLTRKTAAGGTEPNSCRDARPL